MSILIDQRVFTLDIDDEKRLSATVESLFGSTPMRYRWNRNAAAPPKFDYRTAPPWRYKRDVPSLSG